MRDSSSICDRAPRSPAVLVVAAEPRSADEMLEWLRAAGYDAHGATSFDEARTRLRTAAPQLLIADIRLGAFNGLHLVITTHTDHPGMRALVLASTDDPLLATEARLANAGYLIRPVTRDTLLAAVAETLQPDRLG
jgi:DNA-binding NtrC family response regulator